MKLKKLWDSLSTNQIFTDGVELEGMYKDLNASFTWKKFFTLALKTAIFIFKIAIRVVLFLGKVFLGAVARKIIEKLFGL